MLIFFWFYTYYDKICEKRFKGITHGSSKYYLYLLKIPPIMRWAMKWHKLHEEGMVQVSGILGQFTDKQCKYIDF